MFSITCRWTTNELRTVKFSSLLKSLRYHLVIFFPLDHVRTCATAGPSNPLPPFYDYNQSHTMILCFLAFVRNPLCACTVVCWHHSYISFVTSFFLQRLGPNIWLWFPPFPVSYISLPWGRSFFSVLVCQHNQWNVRSLASLLILDCWRSCQSTAYVSDQTRFLKVLVLQLLFCVCYSYVVNFNITTSNTVTAAITETFVRIVHNFQHFTVCHNFSCHCCAPSITPESTAERSALTENKQGEYQQLQNVCW